MVALYRVVVGTDLLEDYDYPQLANAFLQALAGTGHLSVVDERDPIAALAVESHDWQATSGIRIVRAQQGRRPAGTARCMMAMVCVALMAVLELHEYRRGGRLHQGRSALGVAWSQFVDGALLD